jgi:single-strand DNA-binding protein
MNKLEIIGNLTRDPESRTLQDGKTVCNFTVAVNRRKRDANGNNIADFFRVSAWGAMGENCQKYLVKGKKVGVVGSVSVHPFLAQDGTAKATIEVFAEEVEFLSPVGNSEQPPAAVPEVPVNMTPVAMADGELPF